MHFRRLLPAQPVQVAQGDRLHQDDEQQGQRGSVVIEDVEPVAAGLHGEHHADGAVGEAHQTWDHKTPAHPPRPHLFTQLPVGPRRWEVCQQDL